ncbi:helix-hairpin-helix domain-containing protein [Rhodoferax sp.]|uniref:ComEA family DNA-binding protein n=1 Tax=Rhodoferax sp. TaxID=50421 RepID=UPI00261F1DAA|nr:helix-hairpin-helix domain-containing protein [Rhodoferax sp.]MDD2807993.1 helix-hairpin-helix domain-containing protein [Rhodoferax sp.]MDD4942026.1 helix-hairpin-helix domain-containing protein [Rhodoferax sp.]MDD5478552.1 helix-hairpin-helix domain-containing protein [Rhodoferax sp.]
MLKKLVTLCALCTALACLAAIDLNQASEAELDSIKGVGPGTSSKILAERKKAPFKDWNDVITRVQGIGARKAANFSAEGVTVNALPFAPVHPAIPAKSGH